MRRVNRQRRGGRCPLVAPSFAQRGELVNAARDAEGLGEWFPDDGQ